MSILSSPFGQRGWYPYDADELADFIEENSSAPEKGAVHSMICPHAGYAYCGSILGQMMGLSATQPIDHVIVIGPSHYVHLNDQISIPLADTYQTEIGSTRINQDMMQHFSDGCIQDDAIHQNEHSIWMLLPFIQYFHPEATVSPFIVGELSQKSVAHFSTVLKPYITDTTLIVISSDFTHYGTPFNYVPFTENIPENIYDLDHQAISLITEKDAIGFWNFYHQTPTTICGRYAISILLALLDQQPVIDQCYTRSGDISGDWSHSVSYAGVAFGTAS